MGVTILGHFKENIFLLSYTFFSFSSCLPSIIAQKPLFPKWKGQTRMEQAASNTCFTKVLKINQREVISLGETEWRQWRILIINMILDQTQSHSHAGLKEKYSQGSHPTRGKGTTRKEPKCTFAFSHKSLSASRLRKSHFPSSSTSWISIKTEAGLKPFLRKQNFQVILSFHVVW